MDAMKLVANHGPGGATSIAQRNFTSEGDEIIEVEEDGIIFRLVRPASQPVPATKPTAAEPPTSMHPKAPSQPALLQIEEVPQTEALQPAASTAPLAIAAPVATPGRTEPDTDMPDAQPCASSPAKATPQNAASVPSGTPTLNTAQGSAAVAAASAAPPPGLATQVAAPPPLPSPAAPRNGTPASAAAADAESADPAAIAAAATGTTPEDTSSPTVEPAPAPPEPLTREHLSARVRDLVAFIPAGCPPAVIVTWLLQEALRLAEPPAGTDADAAAETAAVLQAFRTSLDQRAAEARALLQQDRSAGAGESLERLASFDTLPPMLQEMYAGDRVAADLRRQLAALEAEEAAWHDLERKYTAGAAGKDDGHASAGPGPHAASGGGADGCGSDGSSKAEAGDPDAVMQDAGGADGTGATATPSKRGSDEPLPQLQPQPPGGAPEEPRVLPQQQLSAVVAELRAARERADFELELQVEALEEFIVKAELLVAQAQQTCSALQASYHKENFASYRHVTSPQALVKFFSQSVVPPAQIDFVPSTQPSQQAG